MKHAVRHLHFVGIGGSGMSPIAEILHRLGYRVTGSDRQDSAVLQRLAAIGIGVFVGHDAGQITGADAVVTSTAVAADNPEVEAARAVGMPVVARAAVLAELMRLRLGIAVAGTHGKTTTTSLVASVLMEAGADPSFVIGGQLMAVAPAVTVEARASDITGADAEDARHVSFEPPPGPAPVSASGPTLGSTPSPGSGSTVGSTSGAALGARLGGGDFIVVEADESDASFLQLTPVVAVVTNIDADHMETYGHDVARLHGAFVDFVQRLPFYGRAIVCSDDAGVQAVLPRLQRPLTTYGLGAGAHLLATDVRPAGGGRMQFTARQPGHADLAVTLNLAGEHNVRNALAAIAVAREIGLPDAPIARGLAGFAGVGRRFQRHGDVPVPGGGHYTLVDDYGHHPVEIAAVLDAARGAFPGRRLLLAFQPHRYTRTRDCMAGFADVLQRFDGVWLTDVYAAGEAPIQGADAAALARAVPGARFVGPLSALPAAIAASVQGGDVVVTMGAGSIATVPGLLLPPKEDRR